jgi:hypothetical protein
VRRGDVGGRLDRALRADAERDLPEQAECGRAASPQPAVGDVEVDVEGAGGGHHIELDSADGAAERGARPDIEAAADQPVVAEDDASGQRKLEHAEVALEGDQRVAQLDLRQGRDALAALAAEHGAQGAEVEAAVDEARTPAQAAHHRPPDPAPAQAFGLVGEGDLFRGQGAAGKREIADVGAAEGDGADGEVGPGQAGARQPGARRNLDHGRQRELPGEERDQRRRDEQMEEEPTQRSADLGEKSAHALPSSLPRRGRRIAIVQFWRGDVKEAMPLQPAPGGVLVAAIGVSETGFEIAFLAQHHAVMHDRQHRHQKAQHPGAVRRQCDSGVAEAQADIDWIAGKAVRARGHERRRRQHRGNVRFGPAETDHRHCDESHAGDDEEAAEGGAGDRWRQRRRPRPFHHKPDCERAEIEPRRADYHRRVVAPRHPLAHAGGHDRRWPDQTARSSSSRR